MQVVQKKMIVLLVAMIQEIRMDIISGLRETYDYMVNIGADELELRRLNEVIEEIKEENEKREEILSDENKLMNLAERLRDSGVTNATLVVDEDADKIYEYRHLDDKEFQFGRVGDCPTNYTYKEGKTF